MEEIINLETAIDILIQAKVTGAAIILNNMNEEHQNKLIESMNKFKTSQNASFILGVMAGLGYFDNK